MYSPAQRHNRVTDACERSPQAIRDDDDRWTDILQASTEIIADLGGLLGSLKQVLSDRKSEGWVDVQGPGQ